MHHEKMCPAGVPPTLFHLDMGKKPHERGAPQPERISANLLPPCARLRFHLRRQVTPWFKLGDPKGWVLSMRPGWQLGATSRSGRRLWGDACTMRATNADTSATSKRSSFTWAGLTSGSEVFSARNGICEDFGLVKRGNRKAPCSPCTQRGIPTGRFRRAGATQSDAGYFCSGCDPKLTGKQVGSLTTALCVVESPSWGSVAFMYKRAPTGGSFDQLFKIVAAIVGWARTCWAYPNAAVG